MKFIIQILPIYLNYIYIDMAYYTREYSPPGFTRDNNEHSPETRLYNVEESQRKY